jgi:predicted nucleotidyltransferase
MSSTESLNQVLVNAQVDSDILAVVVYGSYARGESYRDIDVCLVLWPFEVSEGNSLQKEIAYSEPGIDVHLFQALPLYIQIKVLEEGVSKLVKDDDAYYDLVRITLQQWEDFRPLFESYLEEVLNEPKDSGQVR